MLDRRTFIGAFGREGALADYIVVPDGRVLPIRVVPHVSYPRRKCPTTNESIKAFMTRREAVRRR